MTLQSKYRLVLAAALFLLAVNVAAIASIVVHLQAEKKATVQNEQTNKYSTNRRYASQGRINYRKLKLIEEKLQLTPEQNDIFVQIYREHLQEAHVKFDSIRTLRSMINSELAKKRPNMRKIERYADQIGRLHKELTINQVNMYMEMAEHCNGAQRDSLYKIYMQYQEPPRYGRKNRKSRWNK